MTGWLKLDGFELKLGFCIAFKMKIMAYEKGKTEIPRFSLLFHLQNPTKYLKKEVRAQKSHSSCIIFSYLALNTPQLPFAKFFVWEFWVKVKKLHWSFTSSIPSHPLEELRKFKFISQVRFPASHLALPELVSRQF